MQDGGMRDRDKYRDFKWWLCLAVVVGITWFGTSLHRSFDGPFPPLRPFSAVVRSIGGSLAAVGLVAALGLFVSRSPASGRRVNGGDRQCQGVPKGVEKP